MKLQQIKNTVLGGTMVVLMSVPVVRAMQYYFQTEKYKQMVAFSNSVAGGKSMPTSMADYEAWVQTANPKDVENYNNILSALKRRGTCSDKFLSDNGFASQDEFKQTLQNYVDQAKQGVAGAQEKYTLLYNSYQDDFYYQCSVEMKADEPIGEILDSIIPPEVEEPTQDGTDIIDTGTSTGNGVLSEYINNIIDFVTQYDKMLFLALGAGCLSFVGYKLYNRFKGKGKGKNNDRQLIR